MTRSNDCSDCPPRSTTRSLRIPVKYAPMLFGFILSGLMSFLVSGIATLRAAGLSSAFPGLWTSGWLTAWVIAFPVVLVVAPLARKAVQKLAPQP